LKKLLAVRDVPCMSGEGGREGRKRERERERERELDLHT
jgi:hypothetical protein